ncbi:MAG: hypothetical protein JRH20_30110 [Deltaproteobacteria bacterium]|nr:hypothetical protein [Deltaproteobacteria bacterium]
MLATRSWPGNVRELRNVLERAAVFADGVVPIGGLEELPIEESVVARPAPVKAQGSDELVLPERLFAGDYKSGKREIVTCFERDYFARLVTRHGDNISAIAREADVARDLVRRLLAKHGLRDE